MPDSPTRPRPRDQDRSLTEIPHAPTRYVQLLTPRRARAYLTNATEGGFCRAYAQGFFLPADALPHSPTASAILQLMDLGWLCESGTLASFTGPPPNAQGLPPATDAPWDEEGPSCVYLLHFDVLPDIEATLTRQDPPGAAPASAPWWHSSEPMTLLPGARIEAVDEEGNSRVPVVVTAQGRVHAEAPDPRAVDILFPGPASFVPGPGPHVWVDVTDQGGVLLEATTTGQLFGSARLSARIVGESEDEWHYHTPSFLRRVDPTSRPPHWGAKRLITKLRERLTPRDGQGTAP